MDRCEKSQERREFLKNWILGGVILVSSPLWRTKHLGSSRKKANTSKQDEFLNAPSKRIIQIVRRYGGEFGTSKGGS